MTALLEIDHLTVRFGHHGLGARLLGRAANPVVAVDDVSLSVPLGSALGVVGESGSGKSTLMRTVLGLHQPDSGEVRYRGERLGVSRTLATRRAIQMVFQDPGTTLNPAMSVEQTLSELLRVHRIVKPEDVDGRVGQLLELVHLPDDIRHSRPSIMSGGQKQRVAIARALALEPELIVADEATSALDVVVQSNILDLLNELRCTTQVTLVCITHDLDLVRYLCDAAVVMRHGRVVESGSVDQMFDSPHDPYTRELIDSAPKLGAVDGTC